MDYYQVLDIALVVLGTVLVLVAWIGNLIGLPGNWVSVGTAVLCWWLVPADWRLHVSLPVVVWSLVWAILGELIEFAAGAIGARSAGGSRRSTVLAVVGSMAGGIAGLFIGTLIPIPLLGNVIGAILLGSAGAFVGALAGERWVGRAWNDSIRVGSAAFWGRLFGTVGKVVCGTAIAGGLIAGLILA